MSNITRQRAPNAQPTTADVHAPGSIGGNLKDNIPLTSGIDASENIVCGGVARLRIRAKASVDATLRLRWLRSIVNRDIEYTAVQPADVPMTAGNEAVLDVTSHMGEGRAAVTITPAADGVLDYCDLLVT